MPKMTKKALFEILRDPETPTNKLFEVMFDNWGTVGSFGKLLLEHPNLAQAERLVLSILKKLAEVFPSEVFNHPIVVFMLNAGESGDELRQIISTIAERIQDRSDIDLLTVFLPEIFDQPQNGKMVAIEISKNPNAGPLALTNIYEQFSQTPYQEYLFASLAEHPNAPVELLEKLVSTGDYRTVSNVAGNPNVGEQLARRIFRDFPHGTTRMMLVGNRTLPTSLLDEILESEDWLGYLLGPVSNNPNVSKTAIEHILANRDAPPIVGLATNPNLSQEVYEKLFELRDIFEDLPEILVSNPSCPAHIIEEVVRTSGPRSDTWAGLARNPRLSKEHAMMVARSQNNWATHLLASSPNTHLDVLKVLSKNWYDPTRRAASDQIKAKTKGKA